MFGFRLSYGVVAAAEITAEMPTARRVESAAPVTKADKTAVTLKP